MISWIDHIKKTHLNQRSRCLLKSALIKMQQHSVPGGDGGADVDFSLLFHSVFIFHFIRALELNSVSLFLWFRGPKNSTLWRLCHLLSCNIKHEDWDKPSTSKQWTCLHEQNHTLRKDHQNYRILRQAKSFNIAALPLSTHYFLLNFSAWGTKLATLHSLVHFYTRQTTNTLHPICPSLLFSL